MSLRHRRPSLRRRLVRLVNGRQRSFDSLVEMSSRRDAARDPHLGRPGGTTGSAGRRVSTMGRLPRGSQPLVAGNVCSLQAALPTALCKRCSFCSPAFGQSTGCRVTAAGARAHGPGLGLRRARVNKIAAHEDSNAASCAQAWERRLCTCTPHRGIHGSPTLWEPLRAGHPHL